MSSQITDLCEVTEPASRGARPWWLCEPVVGAALACSFGSTACGSSSRHATSSDTTDGGALYAVSANIYSSDFMSQTSLLWSVGDLGSGSVDRGSAVQLPGGASIWGVPQAGIFYVVSAESLTISKYGIAGGSPQPIGSPIGLAGAGVTNLMTPQVIFDNPHHAFFLDIVSRQALELNLDAMAIVRSVDMKSVAFDNTQLSNLGPQLVDRGGRFITTVFGTSPTYDHVYGTSRILFFNPTDGSFQTKDVACGGVQYSVQTSNGDIFFSSDPYVASIYLIDPTHNPAPCMVRLPANANDPDPNVIALNGLTGGPTGGLIAGSNDTAFLRVLDTSAYMLPSGATYAGPFSAPNWQTWSISLDNPTVAKRTNEAPLEGGIKTFSADGQTYVNDSAADYSSTTLVRTTGADAPASGLKMPGVIWGIVRVR
jgi:hypothetical protein